MNIKRKVQTASLINGVIFWLIIAAILMSLSYSTPSNAKQKEKKRHTHTEIIQLTPCGKALLEEASKCQAEKSGYLKCIKEGMSQYPQCETKTDKI